MAAYNTNLISEEVDFIRLEWYFDKIEKKKIPSII